MSPTLEIELPSLHAGQREVRDNTSRFRVLACGRRWGKTRLGVVLAIEVALRGGRAWWVAPDYKRAEEGWSLIRQFARMIPGTQVREVDRQAKFPTNGVLEVRSADAPDSLRGAGLDFLVIDEAAFVKEQAWIEALRPTLSDHGGRALFISTPAGRNWFWRIWQRGHEGGDWRSWQFPTSSNPYIDPLEIEAARGDMPERTFIQEYLADFSENEGVFFPEWSEKRHVCEPFTIPADWLRWVSIDWGYADPFCAYWFARTPDKKRTYLYREAYQRGLRDEQQAKLLKQLTGTKVQNRRLSHSSLPAVNCHTCGKKQRPLRLLTTQTVHSAKPHLQSLILCEFRAGALFVLSIACELPTVNSLVEKPNIG